MSAARGVRLPILRFSLRARFLALFFLLVVPTSAGTGWYLYDESRQSLADQVEGRVRTIAWALAFTSRYAVMTRDGVVLAEIADRAFDDRDIVHIAFSDHGGEILLERWKPGYGSAADPSREPDASLFEVEMLINSRSRAGAARVDPEVEATFGVPAQGRVDLDGTVRVGLSRRHMEDGLRRALRSAVGLFTLSVAFGSLVVLVSLRYLIHPIERLSERLSRVAAGDFNSRVPETWAGEIGRLARSFNQMAESLQLSRAATKEAQEALLQSSRLAAVGEVAGQAAHEILNPIAAVYGRLENERHELGSHHGPLLQVLEQIVEGWSEEYRSGGLPALEASFRRRVPGRDGCGTVPLLEEDLDNLKRILGGFRRLHDQRAHQIDFLLKEIERVTRIVEGMRSMSRSAITLEELDVAQVVEESIEVLRDPIEKRAIRVEMAKERAALRVRADRGELVQIFTNLLRNAMQAIDAARARGEGEILIEIVDSPRFIEVRVQDNGAGIALDHQAKLFETTFTTKGPREGTGLGLGICRRLARRTRGDVRLGWSAPTKGTKMIVELPRSDAA
ncbi:MAG: HAMP domain-containing histidine kinase [Acidobacteria bacterium]|nr:HAMP domain-containing histidine kinase [Acidobacteriota bacterium]